MIGLNFKDVNHVFHVHRLHLKLQEVFTFFLHEADKLWPETTWVVTSVFRNDGGVHNHYRGIDLVPEDRDLDKMKTMEDRVNAAFDYGKEGLKVCPDIHHGTAPHNHLQARDSTRRKEKARV
jgi:hypothetical protein